MLKITAIVALLVIGTTEAAACDSCGSECISACGTRHFKTCCFNYLRRKREPEDFKFYTPTQDVKPIHRRSNSPMFVLEKIAVPDQWFSNENNPFFSGDMADNDI